MTPYSDEGINPDLVRLYYRQGYANRTKAYCLDHRQQILPRLLRATDPVDIERLRSEIRAIDVRTDEIDKTAESTPNEPTSGNTAILATNIQDEYACRGDSEHGDKSDDDC